MPCQSYNISCDRTSLRVLSNLICHNHILLFPIGVKCGICPTTFAYHRLGCTLCLQKGTLQQLRIVAGTCVIVIFIFVYLILAWRPLIPLVDWVGARIFSACLSPLKMAMDLRNDTKSILNVFKSLWAKVQAYSLPQYIKILVGYCQVLSAFKVRCPH